MIGQNAILAESGGGGKFPQNIFLKIFPAPRRERNPYGALKKVPKKRREYGLRWRRKEKFRWGVKQKAP